VDVRIATPLQIVGNVRLGELIVCGVPVVETIHRLVKQPDSLDALSPQRVLVLCTQIAPLVSMRPQIVVGVEATAVA